MLHPWTDTGTGILLMPFFSDGIVFFRSEMFSELVGIRAQSSWKFPATAATSGWHLLEGLCPDPYLHMQSWFQSVPGSEAQCSAASTPPGFIWSRVRLPVHSFTPPWGCHGACPPHFISGWRVPEGLKKKNQVQELGVLLHQEKEVYSSPLLRNISPQPPTYVITSTSVRKAK